MCLCQHVQDRWCWSCAVAYEKREERGGGSFRLGEHFFFSSLEVGNTFFLFWRRLSFFGVSNTFFLSWRWETRFSFFGMGNAFSSLEVGDTPFLLLRWQHVSPSLELARWSICSTSFRIPATVFQIILT